MAYGSTDLMIVVLPKAGTSTIGSKENCFWNTRICASPSFCEAQSCMAGASLAMLGCPFCTFGITVKTFGNFCLERCDHGSHDPWVIGDLKELEDLRTDLKDTLTELERIEGPLKTRLEARAAEVKSALKTALDQARANAKG